MVCCEKKQIKKLIEVKKSNGDKLPQKYIVQFDPDETVRVGQSTHDVRVVIRSLNCYKQASAVFKVLLSAKAQRGWCNGSAHDL